jgi:mannose-6-phosphate isomerase-like protein (cupin superfamily)
MGHERLIAANHLNHVVIVETPDSVFVSDIENSRDVKSIVATLKDKGRWEYQQHTTASKPWGSLTSLETKDHYRVSRMIVYPESTLTVGSDSRIFKTFVVVAGTAGVMLGAEYRKLQAGESMQLPPEKQMVIRNDNDEPLVIIQIKTSDATITG